MKIKYDANQQFQKDAIESIVGLFEGQPKDAEKFISNMQAKERDGELFAYEIGAVGNNLLLGNEAVLENLQTIQNNNGVPVSTNLQGMNFSIEMETGTGKTYVYLRTIFELAKQYNFTKFIILVPSIAIKEGVRSSIESMREHFLEQYAEPFDFYVYDGKSPETVQSFATSTNIQIMVMTIQSIRGDKSKLVFHQERDKLNGIAPVDFMAATNPIVIMDEPQNMESDLAKGAIDTLSPLCTLRYSATHRNEYNLTYRLDPIDAHKLGLVKGITVASAIEKGAEAKAYLRLVDVVNTKGIEAHVEVIARKPGGELQKKTIKVRKDIDLHRATNNEAYADGYIINEISVQPKYIELSGKGIVKPEDTQDDNSDKIYREMIRETIREHFDKAYRSYSERVKVISLFFVDKVSSYIEYDDSGAQIEGKFARWFDEVYAEEFRRAEQLYEDFSEIVSAEPASVRKAYFAEMKKQGTSRYTDTTGASKIDDDAYDLIMRGKERLLDYNEPVQFVFSHSALKEGWDNPNVFQICMMRESNSELDRRQTIGRGLRLPVRQDGTRVMSKSLNQLTVIANESYTDFATSLQNEYKRSGVKIGYVRKEEFAKIMVHGSDTDHIGSDKSEKIWHELLVRGMIDVDGKVLPNFDPMRLGFTLNLSSTFKPYEPEIIATVSECKLERFVGDVKNRITRTFNKAVLNSPELEELWAKISHRTTYKVDFDRDQIIESAIRKIKAEPAILPLRISIEKNQIQLLRGGVHKEAQVNERTTYLTDNYDLPNIVQELQEATSLTRQTIVDILIGSGRLNEFIHNPNDFIQMVKRCIKYVLSEVIVNGIEYERITGSVYELRELKQDSKQEAKRIIDQLYKVKNTQKSIVDYIVFDSAVENNFAEFLDGREDVKLFLKLPDKFTIDTPVGAYNPDWAILKETDGREKIYMIRETKGTQQQELLRSGEQAKIACAKKHFEAIGIDNYSTSSPENWNI